MKLAIGLGLTAIAVGTAALFSMPPDREIASFGTALEGRTPNQRYNAARAARALDGAVIPPGGTLSFNDRVGSTSRDQGYRPAPVSFNGQLVHAPGGGVCQTSTTLYNAALCGGLQILSRERHRYAPSYAPPGRDAAVAYPGIDLVVRNPYSFPVRVQMRTERGWLACTLRGAGSTPKVEVWSEVVSRERPRTFLTAARPNWARVRNSGNPGFEAIVRRRIGERIETVSRDSYPAMHRVIAD